MQVNCSLCGSQNLDTNMFACYDQGVKTYECTDEKKCNYNKKIYKEKQNQEKLQKFKDANIDISWDNLEELPRFRDASIHYYDRKHDLFFIKSIYESEDVLPKFNPNDQHLRKYV